MGPAISGWRVSYASLIGFTVAGLKAYEWGWAPAQRTWSKRTFFFFSQSVCLSVCPEQALKPRNTVTAAPNFAWCRKSINPVKVIVENRNFFESDLQSNSE